MNKPDLEKRKAHLESVQDQLLSELTYIDNLMRMVGFTNGLATIKATAQDIIKHERLEEVEEDEAA